MAAQVLGIAAVIDSRPVGAFQRGIIAICMAIGFLEGFGVQNAGFVAPALARAFHLNHNGLGLYFSLGLLGLMLGGLFVAPLADRIGRKPVIIACLLLFGLCSLGQAFASSVGSLYLFRFLNLLGIGGAMPNTIAMSAEYCPLRRRSQMIVLVFNGFIAGSICAGLVASWLVEALGYQVVLGVAGVLPLLLAPFALWLLPESVRFLASRGDCPLRVSALMRRIDPSVPADAQFALDHPAERRMSVTALFKEGRGRRTVFLWILVFCSLLDLFLMSNWLPTQIASLGVSVRIAILIGTLLQVGGLVGTAVGWQMDRFGAAKTLGAAYCLGAVAIACIALAGNSVPLLIVSVLAAGFGVLGGQSAANAVAAQSYPTEIRATGVGWYFGVGRLGSILGPSLAGWLLSVGVSNREVFLLAVVPALVAVAASMGLGTPRGSHAPTVESTVTLAASAPAARIPRGKASRDWSG